MVPANETGLIRHAIYPCITLTILLVIPSISNSATGPYADEAGTARLRHVYVLKAERRRGLARMLVRRLLDDAREAGFSEVRLLADTVAGARFYESLGFSSLRSPHGSHVMPLGRVSA